MQSVLVTGGTGFLGKHLVRSLVDDGKRVRVLTRSSKSAQDLSSSVEIIVGDITNADACSTAMQDVDTVFHLAAAYREPGISHGRYREVHVDGTRQLLEKALSQKIKKFVHCSTVGVLSHIENPPADETWPHSPGDIYQETKSEAEILALTFQKTHDFPLTVARPTSIYGPGDMRLLKLFDLIVRRRFVFLGRGDVFYHMIYVDDLVRGIRMLAENPRAVGEVFILGGGEVTTLKELVGLIAEEARVPEPRLYLPAWPIQALGSVVERICVPLGLEPPIYRRRVDFFTKSRSFSIDKARSLLGYDPQVTLKEGIRLSIEWYREHGHLLKEAAR
jgi:dihydroflavonol-4-reductase